MKSDSDGVLSTSTKTTSLWILSAPPISALLAHDFVCAVRLRKSSQNHGPRNLDTSGGLEDPDGRINLLLMRGTLP
jgi:hypothetical protein